MATIISKNIGNKKIMGFTWTTKELSVLEDPNFIDRLGHYVHGDQSGNYKFAMDVMGYKAMYYTSEFETLVTSESSISALQTEVQQVCRGMFAKNGQDSWEVSFKAEALIRNELDPSNHLPIGDVIYATDLIYSNTILYSAHENANIFFTEWSNAHGLVNEPTATDEIVTQSAANYSATWVGESALQGAYK